MNLKLKIKALTLFLRLTLYKVAIALKKCMCDEGGQLVNVRAR